jgi:ABC-type transport system involved in multi-copper enzyme maturation permease subunit
VTPPRDPRLSLLSSALRIFDLSFGQMLWSRRSIFLALVVGGPVALSFVVRAIVTWTPAGLPLVNGARMGGPALFGMIIWLLYVRFVVPVLGVFYGTALIADEVDDRTITYLFTRPIRRAAVLVGKYLAFLACTVLLVLPSVIIVYFAVVPLGGGAIGGEFPSLLADLGMLAIGLAAYGAVFGFVGARMKHPLIAGLVFAFGWEPGVLLFPGYLKQLTVAYYLQALVPHVMPEDSATGVLMQLFNEGPSAGMSVLSLGLITVAALWWAGRSVERREYVLEQ